MSRLNHNKRTFFVNSEEDIYFYKVEEDDF